MTPLEAAKILIFSKNHYDIRNQRPENVLKRLERLSLEGKKCTNLNKVIMTSQNAKNSASSLQVH